MKKLLLGLICLGLGANEFGYMGNKAAGMGGSGTAVGSNPFSAYYNPALLGVDSGLKLGYSAGIRYKEKNIGSITQLKPDSKIPTNNSLGVFSENGLALQIPIPLGGIFSSAIGIGAFYTTMGTINFIQEQNTSINNGKLSNIRIINNEMDILEIPLSYSFNIISSFGSLYIGTNMKYINASHGMSTKTINSSNVIEDAFDRIYDTGNRVKTNAFGVDAGIAYALPLDILVIGVVAKNINAPEIKTIGIEKFKLDRQYRLGLATEAIPLTTIAFDMDLKENVEFNGLNNGISKLNKVQYVSLGGTLDLFVVDIKAGVAKNVANKNEPLLVSGGFGFKFIDFVVFSSTKMMEGRNIPTQFGVKVGGGFSF